MRNDNIILASAAVGIGALCYYASKLTTVNVRETKRIALVGVVCIDIIFDVETYPKEDSKSRTYIVERKRGGNASTNAVVMGLLGSSGVTFIGPLGTDNTIGDIISEFTEANVDYTFSPRRNAPQSTSYVLRSQATGSRTIVHHPSCTPFIADDWTPHPQHLDWAHFEGRNSEEFVKLFPRLAAAGVFISVEVEKIRRDGDIEFFLSRPGVKLAFVSKDYVRERGFEDAEGFLDKFLPSAAEPDVIVVIPWGETGAYGRKRGNQTLFSPSCPPEKVVDTLGAGDTFNGAFLHAMRSGKQLQDCLDFGNKVAGFKVGHLGTTCVKQLRNCL